MNFEDGPNDSVVVHENAHQWFGDERRRRTWRNIWLNEGFATFAEFLWSEHEGFDTAQETFDFFYNDIPPDDPFWQVVIGDPGHEQLFDDAVYLRGAMTLQALRARVGDRAFFTIMRRWVVRAGWRHRLHRELRGAGRAGLRAAAGRVLRCVAVRARAPGPGVRRSARAGLRQSPARTAPPGGGPVDPRATACGRGRGNGIRAATPISSGSDAYTLEMRVPSSQAVRRSASVASAAAPSSPTSSRSTTCTTPASSCTQQPTTRPFHQAVVPPLPLLSKRYGTCSGSR